MRHYEAKILKIFSAVAKQVSRRVDPRMADACERHTVEFVERISAVSTRILYTLESGDYTYKIARSTIGWYHFFWRQFGIRTDISLVRRPWRCSYREPIFVMVPKELTLNTIWSRFRETNCHLFSSVGDDLESMVKGESRKAGNCAYMVACDSDYATDPDTYEKSADEMCGNGHNPITLTEFLLLEFRKYEARRRREEKANDTCFDSDICDNQTRVGIICAGTRFTNNSVPYALSAPDEDQRLQSFWIEQREAHKQYQETGTRTVAVP